MLLRAQYRYGDEVRYVRYGRSAGKGRLNECLHVLAVLYELTLTVIALIDLPHIPPSFRQPN